jgi:hypothetical protein
MSQEIRLWEVKEKSLREVPRDKIGFEEQLEEWLEQDISIISDDLLVIGRQVGTAFEKYIDLLCIKGNGDLVIVELKKDKAPREVIAQVLEYASWVDDLSYEDISDIANDYLKEKGLTLEEAFEKKFGEPLPDVINESHEMPTNKKEWKFYKNAPPEYSGYEGFFKDKEEVKNFISKLRELKSKA